MPTQTKNKLAVTLKGDREVVMTRVFNAPRKLVWEAWTSPEHMPHWMLGPPGWTMPICEYDTRPGAAYRLVWRRENGTEMEIRGVHKEVAPPGKLVSTENWGAQWPETLNTLTLAEQGGKTTLTLVMRFPSTAAREAALKTGMNDGMEQGCNTLDKYLKTMA